MISQFSRAEEKRTEVCKSEPSRYCSATSKSERNQPNLSVFWGQLKVFRSLHGVIVRVKVVLKIIVVGDRRLGNLSKSHVQS